MASPNLGTINPENPHASALTARHARIEGLIAAEMTRPVPDSTTLARLKRQKLKLKEEVAGMVPKN
ncbi:MAG: YdcH family protein [Sandaracinobacteroides sp.]